MRKPKNLAEEIPPDEALSAPGGNYELPARLSRDLKAAAKSLGPDQARYIVDLYYQVQRLRIAAEGQVRGGGGKEPNALLAFLGSALVQLERNIVRAMDSYTDEQLVSRWAKSQCGIGPVLAAGLMAHIDPTRALTAGAVWRFAGLDPTLSWTKGQKRPYNARLKTLCWKISTSFWKNHNREACFYGHLIADRKAQEIEKNEAGVFAGQAALTLEAKKFRESDTRTSYEAGKLPPGRLQLRAQRYGVKIFLAHWWQTARESLGLPVPKPYILTREDGAHVHEITRPNWPVA